MPMPLIQVGGLSQRGRGVCGTSVPNMCCLAVSARRFMPAPIILHKHIFFWHPTFVLTKFILLLIIFVKNLAAKLVQVIRPSKSRSPMPSRSQSIGRHLFFRLPVRRALLSIFWYLRRNPSSPSVLLPTTCRDPILDIYGFYSLFDIVSRSSYPLDHFSVSCSQVLRLPNPNIVRSICLWQLRIWVSSFLIKAQHEHP